MMKFDLDAITSRVLNRLGGKYLPLTALLVQVVALVASPGFVIAQINARFSPEQINRSLWVLVGTGLLSVLAVGLWGWMSNRDAVQRLDQLKALPTSSARDDLEERAWRQINSMTIRYIPVVAAAFIFGQFLPVTAYLYFVEHITNTQVIYYLFGSVVAALASTTLAIILLENLLRPARRQLLPETYETQLKGTSAFGLTLQLLGLSAVLILMSTLLLGPIGYRHTMMAATQQSTGVTLASFQFQSIMAVLAVLLFGLLASYLILRTITRPFQTMISAFKLVEQGDLSRRINVLSTDEAGELAIYFNRMLSQLSVLQGSLEKQVQERTSRLRATVQVSNAITAILDTDELIERVVNVIAEEFDYYYAALFLTDVSGRWAELRAATGDAGRVLRANHHRLEIGSRNMVGRSIQTREPVVAMNTAEAPARFENPLLPYTRSEIALPLIVGDRVYGALDAQSTREGEFTPEVIETLKTMANQVAVALDNAHSFQNAQRSIQDMQSIQRQYLMNAWEGFTRENGLLDYTIGETEPGEIVTETEVPLTLRDQPIGVIQVTGGRDWTPEERSMIEAIAAQAALALENARLVEESQSSARREHVVAEITGKIWTSTTTDSILQTAARELGRVLETDEVTIELKVEDE